MKDKVRRIGIVGFGKAGSFLTYLLAKEGYFVRVVSRQIETLPIVLKNYKIPMGNLLEISQEADIIFITTPDGIIGEIVAQLAEIKEINAQAVLHLSGKHSTEIFRPLENKGLAVGSLHPMQSLANLEQALVNLPGSAFVFQGDSSLIPWISAFIENLHCHLIVAPESLDKSLYHAGASIASNFLVLLAKMAMDCLKTAGLSESEGQKALIPLMKGTLVNLGTLSPQKALTGPIARGDIETVQSHLKSLEKHLPNLVPIYQNLGFITGDLAMEAGLLDARKYNKLKESLRG